MTFDPRVVSFRRPQPESSTEAEISSYLDAHRTARDFQVVEARLGLVAVVLIGHKIPTPKPNGNGTENPTFMAIGKDPKDAAKKTQLENPNKYSPRIPLRWVWTKSEAHAKRLKAALDERILGNDPAMVELNGKWRDLPEWEVKWNELLADAFREVEQSMGSEKEPWHWDDDGKKALIDRIVSKRVGLSR